MNETSPSRPSLWWVVLAVLVAATDWAAVATASGGSASTDTSSPSPPVASDAVLGRTRRSQPTA